MKAMATAFERCVRSFKEEIVFKFPDVDKAKATIFKRTGEFAPKRSSKLEKKLADLTPPIQVCLQSLYFL